MSILEDQYFNYYPVSSERAFKRGKSSDLTEKQRETIQEYEDFRGSISELDNYIKYTNQLYLDYIKEKKEARDSGIVDIDKLEQFFNSSSEEPSDSTIRMLKRDYPLNKIEVIDNYIYAYNKWTDHKSKLDEIGLVEGGKNKDAVINEIKKSVYRKAEVLLNQTEQRIKELQYNLPKSKSETIEDNEKLLLLKSELEQAKLNLDECDDRDEFEDTRFTQICNAIENSIEGLEFAILINENNIQQLRTVMPIKKPEHGFFEDNPEAMARRRDKHTQSPEFIGYTESYLVSQGTRGLGSERQRELDSYEQRQRDLAHSFSSPLIAPRVLFRAESSELKPYIKTSNLSRDWSELETGDIVELDSYTFCSTDPNYAAAQFGRRGTLLVIYAPDGTPVVFTNPFEAECNLLKGTNLQVISARDQDIDDRHGTRLTQRVIELNIIAPDKLKVFETRLKPYENSDIEAVRRTVEKLKNTENNKKNLAYTNKLISALKSASKEHYTNSEQGIEFAKAIDQISNIKDILVDHMNDDTFENTPPEDQYLMVNVHGAYERDNESRKLLDKYENIPTFDTKPNISSENYLQDKVKNKLYNMNKLYNDPNHAALSELSRSRLSEYSELNKNIFSKYERANPINLFNNRKYNIRYDDYKDNIVPLRKQSIDKKSENIMLKNGVAARARYLATV